MNSKEIIHISTEQLKEYIKTHNENDYMIIDVRQPEEYSQSHIPGAKLIPFPLIGTEKETLPTGVDLVFSCRSGARSKAAAMLTAQTAKNIKQVYNHWGGILAWDEKTVSDFPRVQALGRKNDFDDMLLTAMDLEKGAWNFYKTILEKYTHEPFSDAIEYLSLAEADHAEALYNILTKKRSNLPGFDDMFHSLKGDILEGGVSLADAINRLEDIEHGSAINILDLALDIEYSAFDLYRTAADLVDDTEIKRIMVGIANGEKSHIKKLAEAFAYLE